MRLNQLADQLSTKTIGLIAIARALKFTDLPNPHGGTPLSAEQSQQIAAVYQYMRDRQMTDPAAALAQMNNPTAADGITISIPESVADELCRRYPDGSMSDRILRLLGALQSFEQLHNPYAQSTALSAPVPTTPHP